MNMITPSAKKRPGRPIVFIHGIWLASSIWDEWIAQFDAWGYRGIAPPWRGERATVEETRDAPGDVAGVDYGILLRSYANLIDSLDEPPIVVGDKLGALIAEQLLAEGLAVAGVALDPTQTQGVIPERDALLREYFPGFIEGVRQRSARMPTEEEFRYGLAERVSDEEAATLYRRHVIPSCLGLFGDVVEPTFTLNAAPAAPVQAPLLVLRAVEQIDSEPRLLDKTVRRYRDTISITESSEFETRGHTMTFDHRWMDVAEVVHDWLQRRGL